LLRDEDVPELRGEQRESIIAVLDRFRVAKSDARTKDRSCDAQVFENGLNRGLKRAHHEATPMSLIGSAPRRRESSVEEDSTRRVVD
jgi:hypothetical protein